MDDDDLTEREQQVYQVVAELETAEEVGYVQTIAERAGFSLEQTHDTLHSLTGRRGLVHEVAVDDFPEGGTQYQMAPRGT